MHPDIQKIDEILATVAEAREKIIARVQASCKHEHIIGRREVHSNGSISRSGIYVCKDCGAWEINRYPETLRPKQPGKWVWGNDIPVTLVGDTEIFKTRRGKTLYDYSIHFDYDGW